MIRATSFPFKTPKRKKVKKEERRVLIVSFLTSYKNISGKIVNEHHEEINGAMNVTELGMVCSVMNKLFERGNVSNTSRAILKPVEDSLSNEEDNDVGADLSFLVFFFAPFAFPV